MFDTREFEASGAGEGRPESEHTRARKGSEGRREDALSDSLPSRPGTADPASTSSRAELWQVFGLVDGAPSGPGPIYSPHLPDGFEPSVSSADFVSTHRCGAVPDLHRIPSPRIQSPSPHRVEAARTSSI